MYIHWVVSVPCIFTYYGYFCYLILHNLRNNSFRIVDPEPLPPYSHDTQVILNIKLQSTAGQSSLSVFIALVGKTTDFVVNYGLNLPLPYVVMTYFSSSSAFLNAFQVILEALLSASSSFNLFPLFVMCISDTGL